MELTSQDEIKMKPIDVKSGSYAEYNVDSNVTKPKLVIMLRFQNTKTFLLKDTLKIVQEKILFLVKLNMQFRGLMVLLI